MAQEFLEQRRLADLAIKAAECREKLHQVFVNYLCEKMHSKQCGGRHAQ